MTNEGRQVEGRHVSGETATFIAEVCADLLVRLGAPRTLVQVDAEPEPDDAYASMTAHEQKHIAVIRVCTEWETRDWKANARTILHETLHYMHSGQDRILRDDLWPAMRNRRWFRVLWDNLNRENELYVDQLTTTLWDALDVQKIVSKKHDQLGYPKVRN